MKTRSLAPEILAFVIAVTFSWGSMELFLAAAGAGAEQLVPGSNRQVETTPRPDPIEQQPPQRDAVSELRRLNAEVRASLEGTGTQSPDRDDEPASETQAAVARSSEVDHSQSLLATIKESDVAIAAVYLLVWLATFWMALRIASRVLTATATDRFCDKLEGLDEWAVSTPPVLGVVGTLAALGSYLAGGEGLSVDSSRARLMSSFGAAISTTVVGGCSYVLNLALGAFLRPRS